ncbi:hypothetical protein [Legionella parisiensis]|uniref:Uncharacterized protein n=1 Tax=Legionella parisiensis TaxID=45071 RepID=A0A1E5JV23_9GAMM|nr:hypothetical protein [Legionella parisiensis]KTD40732.1 hypothetical protein Lpar_2049 [Legionella parisiensis]OEH47898.1 hypothetical protein lpari_01086 [Legionella parisiensis]STX76819.1 Uncharacterised protein [Legionella parisiensis]
MIKNIFLSSLLMLSSLIVLPEVAQADPIGYETTFFCPMAQGGPNAVTNFGSYIGGYGIENILSQTLQVYFRSTGSVQDVPANLINYFNDSVTYNSATGNIICSYQSNNPADPRFTVTYTITNGLGGAVQAQSNNSISIRMPVGLKG